MTTDVRRGHASSSAPATGTVTAAAGPNEGRWFSPRVSSLLLRILPSLFVEIGWWTYALLDTSTRLGRFAEPTPYVGQYYYMTLAMVLGSLVAGATSEGGGAVAFPIMTLLLGCPPPVARDFSFAIQSFGMTCASITILGLRAPIDTGAIVWSSLGGVVGLASGLVWIAPHLPPAYAKMLFVSVWAAFAAALWRLNRSDPNRRVYGSSKESDETLLGMHEGTPTKDEEGEGTSDDPTQAKSTSTSAASFSLRRKRRFILVITGIFGGLTSAISGSGIDMAAFSVLTLYYRVNEKVATPTSVLLMAINAVLGMVFRLAGLGGRLPVTDANAVWNFVAVCVPVVVIGAPTGATISARFLTRRSIARLLYFLDAVQFLTALAVVRPWGKPSPHGWGICVTSAAALILGSAFFFKLGDWGECRDDWGKSAKREKEIVEVAAGNDPEEGSSDIVETSVGVSLSIAPDKKTAASLEENEIDEEGGEVGQ